MTGKQCFQEKNIHKFALPEFETFKMEFTFTFPTNFWYYIINYFSSLCYYCYYSNTRTPAFVCIDVCMHIRGDLGGARLDLHTHSYRLQVSCIHLSTPTPLHNSFNILPNSEWLNNEHWNISGNLNLPVNAQTALGVRRILEYG